MTRTTGDATGAVGHHGEAASRDRRGSARLGLDRLLVDHRPDLDDLPRVEPVEDVLGEAEALPAQPQAEEVAPGMTVEGETAGDVGRPAAVAGRGRVERAAADRLVALLQLCQLPPRASWLAG